MKLEIADIINCLDGLEETICKNTTFGTFVEPLRIETERLMATFRQKLSESDYHILETDLAVSGLEELLRRRIRAFENRLISEDAKNEVDFFRHVYLKQYLESFYAVLYLDSTVADILLSGISDEEERELKKRERTAWKVARETNTETEVTRMDILYLEMLIGEQPEFDAFMGRTAHE